MYLLGDGEGRVSEGTKHLFNLVALGDCTNAVLTDVLEHMPAAVEVASSRKGALYGSCHGQIGVREDYLPKKKGKDR